MDQLLPCMYLTKSSRLSDCQSMESRSWTLWFISSISPGDVTSVHRRSSHSVTELPICLASNGESDYHLQSDYVRYLVSNEIVSIIRLSNNGAGAARCGSFPLSLPATLFPYTGDPPTPTAFVILIGGLFRCGETKSALKDTSKNEALAVQKLRNNIMASMAIMPSSL
ncbi:hypothetical protein LINPERHAP2_LOCUS43532 [Linum perenne]